MWFILSPSTEEAMMSDLSKKIENIARTDRDLQYEAYLVNSIS